MTELEGLGHCKYCERCISLNKTCMHGLIIEYNKLPMIWSLSLILMSEVYFFEQNLHPQPNFKYSKPPMIWSQTYHRIILFLLESIMNS